MLFAARPSLVHWNVVLDSAVGASCQDIARNCELASGSDLPCTVGIVVRHQVWPMAASHIDGSTPAFHITICIILRLEPLHRERSRVSLNWDVVARLAAQ